MKHGAKPPEIRKQELIDIALKLFIERGYELVSVSDILDEIHGQRGMFYHYYKNKQDIYAVAIEQLINRSVNGYIGIVHDSSLEFKDKITLCLIRMQENAQAFADIAHRPDGYSDMIANSVLSKLINPLAELMEEAIDNGIIPETAIASKETLRDIAIFLIYGCHALLLDQFNRDSKKIAMANAVNFVFTFLGI